MLPAIFLDRDGVIIENRPEYVRCWEDVYIFPQALEALKKVRVTPYKIIVITNQAGIGHGLIPFPSAVEINQRLQAAVEQAGGRIDAVYMCPHKPGDGCECRKPRPGMIEQASREHNLDLGRSFLIGDTLFDLMAGRLAGVKDVALVRTGLGAQQTLKAWDSSQDGFPIFDTLAQALDDLVVRPLAPRG